MDRATLAELVCSLAR